MTKNLGTLDRVLRAIIALVLGWLVYSGAISGTLGTVLAVMAIGLLFTSLISFCMIYRLLGISTRKVGS